MFFNREDGISKEIKKVQNDNIECPLVEIYMYKTKWLLVGSYNPNQSLINQHLTCLRINLDKYSSFFENILFRRDYNYEPLEPVMKVFCDSYNLVNIVKEPTCFKNTENPRCIDLIITNRKNKCQNTMVIETGHNIKNVFYKTTAKHDHL